MNQPTSVARLAEGRTWEDIPVGFVLRTSGRTATEIDLITFVNLGGFTEPLFTDAGHAAEGNCTGRLIPGAPTYAIGSG